MPCTVREAEHTDLSASIGSTSCLLVQVVAEPLLAPHADYCSGMLIQVHLVQPDSGASALLAVGEPPPTLLHLAGTWYSSTAVQAQALSHCLHHTLLH